MLGIGDFARLGRVSPRALRHYGELGILRPAVVDPANGYRYFAVDQLAELHRIVALRELGLGLDAIRTLLVEEVPVDQLRGMLRLRRAEIAQSIGEEQERLRRVEAHLDAIERGETMDTVEITIKRTDPLRIATTTARAPGYGYENINPVFEVHLPAISERLLQQRLRFGVCVAHYEEDGDDVVVHLGWEVGDQPVEESDTVTVEELPAIEVASTVHRGSMVDVVSLYESMVRWIESSGYQLAGSGRELYWHLDEDPSRQVTEIQLPVVRTTP